MKRRTLFLLLLLPCLPILAQDSKKVRALKQEKAALQNTLKKSQQELKRTKQQVTDGVKTLEELKGQLSSSMQLIHDMEQSIDSIDRLIGDRQGDIVALERDINDKRQRLKATFRYARLWHPQQGALLYALSANDIRQMHRRVRQARDYASRQRAIGRIIVQRQEELLLAQNALLEDKALRADTARSVMEHRHQLDEKRGKQQQQVDALRKRESGLAGKVAQQQKQLAALDKKIDQLIAYEIEQARKKAEEEARRKAAQAAKQKGKGGAVTPAPGKRDTWLTAEDRKLNGTFEQNRGRLPVPVTGKYQIGTRFGRYNVAGTKGVQLDSKGTHYIGQSGAQARAVFDGVVTAVFQFGGTRNVLVRHGSYISVYLNLSSVTVQKGQKVKALQTLGALAPDASGRPCLQFQLRKETAKLNPEAWIGK